MMGYAPILLCLLLIDQVVLGVIGLLITTNLASLPDVDLSYDFLKHRGFTHTITFAFLVGIVFLVVSIPFALVGIHFGFITGYTQVLIIILGSAFTGFYTIVLHIVGDSITPSGVRPFTKPPLIPETDLFTDKRYSFDLVLAKSTLGNGLLLAGGALCITAAFFIGM